MKLLEENKKILQITSIAILLIIGAYLRFNGLSNQSLWYDEIVTWSLSNKANLVEVWNEISKENRPPLHQLLYYFVIKYIGENEFALRLPSAVFGTLSILFIYLLAYRLYSFKEAIISAGFMAVFWLPLYYSQEARDYSLLLMLTIGAVYLWIIINENEKRKDKIKSFQVVLFGLLLALLSYTHYFGLFISGLLFIGSLLLLWKNKTFNYRILISYLLALVLYIPWFNSMLFQASKIQSFWIPKPTIKSIYDVIFYIYATEPILFYMILALLFFSILKFIYNLKMKKQNEQSIEFMDADLMLWLWFLLPILIIFIQSLIFKSLFLERYFLICLPPAYILLSRAILQLPIAYYYRYAVAIIMILFIAFDLIYIQDYYNKPVKKTQIREATEFVLANYRMTNDAIIIGYSLQVDLIQDLFHYYFIQKNSSLRLDYFMSSLHLIRDLEEYIENRKPSYIWLIYSEKQPTESLISLVTVHYKFVHGKDLHKAGAYLFRRK